MSGEVAAVYRQLESSSEAGTALHKDGFNQLLNFLCIYNVEMKTAASKTVYSWVSVTINS